MKTNKLLLLILLASMFPCYAEACADIANNNDLTKKDLAFIALLFSSIAMGLFSYSLGRWHSKRYSAQP